jgi:hypothetical protein
MKALKRRVLAMQARAQARELDRGPSHLIVMPDAWPVEECRAYDVLYDQGEYEAWFALLERHTGQRPGPHTRVIALRLREDGPP